MTPSSSINSLWKKIATTSRAFSIRMIDLSTEQLVRRKIKEAAIQKKMSFIVELQTTNEFFYLKPVLEKLHLEGHFLCFITREKVRPAINELNHSTFTPPLPILDISFAKKAPDTDFYLNATLSYDIAVPPRAKRKISFPHTITSKTKYDVFSPAIEQITDMFITGDVFLKDIETFCRDFNIEKIPVYHKVGCPKSDALWSEKIDKKDFLTSLGLDPALPTIFYAPTWNPDTSLFTWRDDILLPLPLRHKINMIVKIHPGAYIDPENKKSSGGVDWKAFFESENLKKNRIVNAYHSDSPHFIMASDITITDISTVWIEYYFLKKPIIFLDIPKFFSTHEKNSLGEFRDTYGYLVKTVKELDNTINGLLQKNIPLREPPSIHNELLYNPGTSTEATMKRIKELFNK